MRFGKSSLAAVVIVVVAAAAAAGDRFIKIIRRIYLVLQFTTNAKIFPKFINLLYVEFTRCIREK